MREEEPSWDLVEPLVHYLNAELGEKYGIKIENYGVWFGKTTLYFEDIKLVFEAKYFNAYNYSNIIDKIIACFIEKE